MMRAVTILLVSALFAFVTSNAYAICDARGYERAEVVADVVVEDLSPGLYPHHVIATVLVLNAVKGAQAGTRLKIRSAYNQAEMIRFPIPGSEFHLRAIGGPDIYSTNECLYMGSAYPLDEVNRPDHPGRSGWCDFKACQNFMLPEK
jgi:hypothetical protein